MDKQLNLRCVAMRAAQKTCTMPVLTQDWPAIGALALYTKASEAHLLLSVRMLTEIVVYRRTSASALLHPLRAGSADAVHDSSVREVAGKASEARTCLNGLSDCAGPGLHMSPDSLASAAPSTAAAPTNGPSTRGTSNSVACSTTHSTPVSDDLLACAHRIKQALRS